MFFKISLNEDLLNTSYRCYGKINDNAYIEYNSGYKSDNWEEISYEKAYQLFPHWFEEHAEYEETQVSNNEIRDMISNVEETQLTQLMALADIYERFLLK